MQSKYYLQSKIKSTGLAYICWFLLGCHYAYMGRWLAQILFWLTGGGLLIWAFIDLLRIPGMVNRHNLLISSQMETIDAKEKMDEFMKLQMLTGNRNSANNIAETNSQSTDKSISTDDKIEKLKKIKELLDNGILSQEEFDNEKTKILK